jgi:hypothetical protein
VSPVVFFARGLSLSGAAEAGGGVDSAPAVSLMLDLAFKKKAGGKFIDRNLTGAGGFKFAERM